jgi:hypothetical protein
MKILHAGDDPDRSNRFRDTVLAVHEIIDKKLYKQKNLSIEAYFKQFWNISRAQAYRLFNCGIILRELAECPIPPNRERYCRILKQLVKTKAERLELWNRVLTAVNNQDQLINSTIITNAYNDMLGIKLGQKSEGESQQQRRKDVAGPPQHSLAHVRPQYAPQLYPGGYRPPQQHSGPGYAMGPPQAHGQPHFPSLPQDRPYSAPQQQYKHPHYGHASGPIRNNTHEYRSPGPYMAGQQAGVTSSTSSANQGYPLKSQLTLNTQVVGGDLSRYRGPSTSGAYYNAPSAAYGPPQSQHSGYPPQQGYSYPPNSGRVDEMLERMSGFHMSSRPTTPGQVNTFAQESRGPPHPSYREGGYPPSPAQHLMQLHQQSGQQQFTGGYPPRQFGYPSSQGQPQTAPHPPTDPSRGTLQQQRPADLPSPPKEHLPMPQKEGLPVVPAPQSTEKVEPKAVAAADADSSPSDVWFKRRTTNLVAQPVMSSPSPTTSEAHKSSGVGSIVPSTESTLVIAEEDGDLPELQDSLTGLSAALLYHASEPSPNVKIVPQPPLKKSTVPGGAFSISSLLDAADAQQRSPVKGTATSAADAQQRSPVKGTTTRIASTTEKEEPA